MNVLVLTVHGLNCHWLGPYGNEWVSTPALDALACESVVFDRHFANDPSPSGWRTSCPPSLFQQLRAAGIRLALVDDRRSAPPDDRPFDVVVRTDLTGNPSPGDARIAAVESALDRLTGAAPWLLWVESDRMIPPWDLDPEAYQHYASATSGFTEDDENAETSPDDPGPIRDPDRGPVAPDNDRLWHRLHNSFAAAVTSFDAELDVLIEVFRERGLDASTAWLLTSGYGWPLGEHEVIGPEPSRMHVELAHVPLLMRLPGGREAMRRVPALTQTSDIPGTLLHLYDVPVSTEPRRPSLLTLATGVTAPLRTGAISRTGTEQGVRVDDWAFLAATADQPARLYRKPDDIWEVNDLAQRHPDECDRLAALLSEAPNEEDGP